MTDGKNTFQESQQTVQFGEGWNVLAIDRHHYYQRVSGKGLKCVDFIALSPDMGLVLIELKNFGGRTIPEDLEDIHKQKTADAKRLIRIVNSYLERQLYYRVVFKFLGWTSLCPKEWQIWSEAQLAINNGKCISLMDIQR